MVLYSIRRYFHHQSHPQLSIISALTQSLSGAISNCPLLFPTTIPDTFRHGAGEWGSYSGIISLFLFILSMEFSRQEYWSGWPFPPPVDHILSELFTKTHPSWVALHSKTHSFIELCKPLHHNKAVTCEGD